MQSFQRFAIIISFSDGITEHYDYTISDFFITIIQKFKKHVMTKGMNNTLKILEKPLDPWIYDKLVNVLDTT